MSTYTTRPLTLLVLLSMVASAGMTNVLAHDQAGSQAVAIARNGSQPSRSGPPQTSRAPCASTHCSTRRSRRATAGAYVTSSRVPGTAWHTHPNGQRLIVTAGSGRVQRWGDSIQEIRPGEWSGFRLVRSTGMVRRRRQR